MMIFKKKYSIVFIVLFVGVVFLIVSFTSKHQHKNVITSREVIERLFSAIDNVKTLRYSLKCNERIHGSMKLYGSQVKLQVNPRKLYLSLKGPELLWVQGANNGDALVNPGTFPYVNLNLDPFGSIMRKDQHHTIHEMGFQYLQEILKNGVKEVGDKFEKTFILVGEEVLNGRPCYKMLIQFPDFAWHDYTVKKGETLVTIARKLKVSEYMILENNRKISWYNDVKEGQVIKVPNAYGKLTILLIDKEYYLPINNTVFDDKGLFEKYEYIDLHVNPVIAPEEFTKTYKGYNF